MTERPTAPGVIGTALTTTSGGWDMHERRSFPRTGMELPVHLTVVPNGGGTEEFVGNLEGMTRDLSRGGCAVSRQGSNGRGELPRPSTIHCSPRAHKRQA